MDAEPPAHWAYYYYYYVLVLWKMSTHLFWNIKRHVIYVLWDIHLTNSNALIQCIFLRIWSSYGNKGDKVKYVLTCSLRLRMIPESSMARVRVHTCWRCLVAPLVSRWRGERERGKKSPALAWFSVSQHGQFTTKPKFSAEMLLTSFNSGGDS